jgi:uncharacterized protein
MRNSLVLAAAIIVMAFPASAEELSARLDAVPYALSLANPAVKAEVSKDRVVLTAPKGTDLYRSAKGKSATNAPRITFAPQGDFIFSAKVDASFGADYDGGALVVYSDDGYWLKFLFERINATESAVTSSFASPVSDNSYHVRVPASPVWLKVARADASLLLYMSHDGKSWQILRDFSIDPARKLEVGFASQAPLGESYKATFTDVRFEAKTITKYWSGE